MKLIALSILTLAAVSLQAQTAIDIPNFGFDNGTDEYTHPTNWLEDQDRDSPGFASSGIVASAAVGSGITLLPYQGSAFAQISITQDGTGTLSTADPVGTFAANTTYVLSAVFSDRIPSYVSDYSGSALLGLRANGVTVDTSTVDMKTADNGVWNEISLTINTDDYQSIIGEDIDIFIGWELEGYNYQMKAYFDDVTLTAQSNVPEPSTYALGLGILVLALGILRRHLGRRNA